MSQDAVEEIEGLMRKGDTASIEKIMDKFIVKDKNLILKTDIENSKNFTILKTIEEDLKAKGLKRSAKTIHNFTEYYIAVRVSHQRLSWKYVFDAISAIKRENTTSSLGAKLLGLGKEKDEK